MALIRISGIVAGGLVSLLFAIVILPRSANVEVYRSEGQGGDAIGTNSRDC